MIGKDITRFLKEKTMPVVIEKIEGPCEEHLQTEVIVKHTIADNLNESHSYLTHSNETAGGNLLYVGEKHRDLPEDYHTAEVFYHCPENPEISNLGKFRLIHSREDLFNVFDERHEEFEKRYSRPDLKNKSVGVKE